MIREAIVIELHPNNMNRVYGLLQSQSWKPLILLSKDIGRL
jgi:hypothetical protein